MGENHNKTGDDDGIKSYITRHLLIGVALAVVVLVVLKLVLGLFEPSGPMLTDTSGVAGHDRVAVDVGLAQDTQQISDGQVLSDSNEDQVTEDSGLLSPHNTGQVVEAIPTHENDTGQPHGGAEKVNVHAAPEDLQAAAAPRAAEAAHPVEPKTAPVPEPAPAGTAAEHATEAHGAGQPETSSFPAQGMAFVDAVIRPLDHELNRSFYGWRPNDILDVTDNVNNFQLGVLEVTRRTAVILAERISRTGSTAAFDANLQNAMNWFMIKADRYWFPSAESKYKAGLMEIRNYFYRLEKGEAQFYSRTDNLIPLLNAYQDLLGSCDDNLVKSYEDDGKPVSFFKSDDYFFYAKGVASAMATVLEGITKDFSVMVIRRGGMEELHHAIESCHHAMEIDPWIVLNSNGSSLFANHRLNMAAPISHARFYIDVLIMALST